MNRHRPPHQPSPCALAALLLTGAGSACFAPAALAQDRSLSTVQVQERSAAPVADVSGFGEVPLRDVPASITVINRREIEEVGARRLADLTRFDASVTDGYNAPGYWDFLSIRGYTLNQSYNYRREGLPISAETVIPLDNKERVEILKGTSGIQAGTSAPGGLVNYVVKRPTETPLRELTVSVGERGSRLLALDLGGRTENKVIGYRLNLAHEDMRPLIEATNGHRDLFALAMDARLSRDTLLAGEFEWSTLTQPSVPGQSLLGSQLPTVGDPNTNLNNQAWSKPNNFDNLTGSLRLDQALNDQWSWQAQYGRQKLKSNDRLAYPFGCSDPQTGLYYADRYCPASSTGKPNVGLADIYQYESDNERRTQQAAQIKLTGNLLWGQVQHQFSTGLLRSVLNNRFGFQTDASAPIGQASTDGLTRIPAPNPPLGLVTPNTNRDEYSTEVFVQDMARWTPRLSTWAGWRQTQLNRHSIQTDGGQETRYQQSFGSPWLGASYELDSGLSAYASWGRGMESAVAPNRPYYANAGVALPVARSTQKEIGLKQAGPQGAWQWQASYFDIRRPALYETQLAGQLSAEQIAQRCPASASDCRVQSFDGDAHHQGIELAGDARLGPWHLSGSAMWLRAVRDSADPSLNGRSPSNVPSRVLRLRGDYAVATVPGLQLGAALSHEGPRKVIDTSAEQVGLPSWTRIDALLSYRTGSSSNATVWTLGVQNLFDRRYWRESPTSYGHLYLYPGAARTLRLTMKKSF